MELTERCYMKIETGMLKVVLIACATLSLGATAMADEMVVTSAKTVKYSRSDAATPAGAVKLYGVLQAAASRACTAAGTRLSGYGDSHVVCKGAALSRAVADVQIDAVTAVYLQDTRYQGKPGTVTVARR
jgi:UrcA family protein